MRWRPCERRGVRRDSKLSWAKTGRTGLATAGCLGRASSYSESMRRAALARYPLRKLRRTSTARESRTRGTRAGELSVRRPSVCLARGENREALSSLSTVRRLDRHVLWLQDICSINARMEDRSRHFRPCREISLAHRPPLEWQSPTARDHMSPEPSYAPPSF